MAGLVFDDDEVKIFLVEIAESMIFHPSVWKVIFGQDWTGLRLSIQAFLGIDLGLSGGNELIGEPVRPEEPKRVTTPRVRP